MKKLMNDPYAYAAETLEGLCRAHPQYYRFSDESRQVVVRPDSPVSGKVGIVTGGGSGHLPVFVGYVGQGLLNACAVGDVFASPSADEWRSRCGRPTAAPVCSASMATTAATS